jgi:hypothetical protein
VHFLFGLAKTDRLIAEIKAELEQAAAQSRRTGKPARRFGRDGGLKRTRPTGQIPGVFTLIL